MRLTLTFLYMLLVPAITWAADPQLTAAQCQEILMRYQIVPDGCKGVPDTSTQPGPAGVASNPAPVSDPISDLQQNHIFFDSGTQISAASQDRMALLAQVLETSVLRTACLRLIGHSDSSGSDAANLEMSTKRAQMVADYLSERLQNANRIEEVLGEGERDLLDGYAPTARENRRVTIYARRCPDV